MNIVLFAGVGLLALAIIAWQTWQEHWRNTQRVPPEWAALIGRITNDQMLGHHREVRNGVLLAFHKLKAQSEGVRVARYVHISLATLLARDPVYPEVVRAIRTACTEEPAVSELALCVSLRHFLVEDIRQCEEIAESFGQIRRSAQGAEPLLIASFHPTA